MVQNISQLESRFFLRIETQKKISTDFIESKNLLAIYKPAKIIFFLWLRAQPGRVSSFIQVTSCIDTDSLQIVQTERVWPVQPDCRVVAMTYLLGMRAQAYMWSCTYVQLEVHNWTCAASGAYLDMCS